MKEQFVTYEIALALKELGFDEECLVYFNNDKYRDLICTCENGMDGDFIVHHYSGDVNAPLWQQVIDWFDNKNIIIGIDINPGTLFYRVHLYKRYYHNPGRLVIGEYFLSGEFNNFISKEEAREQAILKAIELCKEKKN